jgi:hypothetical protein
MTANDLGSPVGHPRLPRLLGDASRPDEGDADPIARQRRVGYPGERITRRPTLTSGLRLSSVAHRFLSDDYGSEGWGFDSLPAR